MDNTPSSKAIEFLAFQITQNKYNGPKSHATFLCLPTKEPLQPMRVFLTESGKTQETPKKERSKVHISLVLSQWRRRWSIDSPHFWQRKHLFAKAQPLFCKWSKVKTLPHEASHAKKLILGWAQDIQIIFEGNKAEDTGCIALCKDFIETTPSFDSTYLTLSSSSILTIFPTKQQSNLPTYPSPNH